MQSVNNFENNLFISKLNLEGHSEPIYVKINWKPNENDLFYIKIFHGHSSWSGKFNNESRDQFTKDTVENEEVYTNIVYKCLTGEDDSYTFAFNPELSVAYFEWKIKYPDTTELLYGSVEVSRDKDQDSKDSLIDYLLSVNNNHKIEVNKYKQKTETLDEELEEYKKRIEMFIQEKNTMETVLYGKFIKLLNTKKERIQFLEDTLQKFEALE